MAIINDVAAQAPNTQASAAPLTPDAIAPANPAAPQQQAAPAASNTEATPQEQEDYEKVVTAGIKAIVTEPVHGQIMKMVSDDKNGEPAKRLARAAVTIMGELDNQSGGTIPQEVILPASAEILENVAEFAKSSGALQVDEVMLGQAGQFMVLEIAEMYGVSPEEMQEFMGSVTKEEAENAVATQLAYSPKAQTSGGAPDPAAMAAQKGGAPAPSSPQEGAELPPIINRTLGA